MKSSLPFLLLAFASFLPLRAAPGTVHDVVQKIADGIPGGLATNSLANQDNFGFSCAVLGDLDGDGVPELAVGALGDDTGGPSRGALYLLFLNANGSVKSTAKIDDSTTNGPALDDGDFFGNSCAALGDLDGDGVPEIAVGALGDDTGDDGRGALYLLFLNANGSVKFTVKIDDSTSNGPVLDDFNQFGSSCAALGDLDGDGVPELAVGANGGRGAVHLLFLNANGSVKSTAKIDDATSNGPVLSSDDNFGSSCAALGDLDGDGVPEIAVGATGDDTGGFSRGALYLLFLNANGSVKSTVKIDDSTSNRPVLDDFNQFGRSCAALGDLDGDGVPEIAVGATNDFAAAVNSGAVHLLFLNANGSVKSTSKIAHGSGGLALADLDGFGTSCAALGDLDGDGVPEIAVGAAFDNTGGNDRGAVFLIEIGAPPLTVTTPVDEFNTPSGPDLSLREAIRDAGAFGTFRTIRFDPSLASGSIEVSTPLPVGAQSLRITGEGLIGGLTVSGQGQSRIFDLNGSTLTIDTINLRDGSASGGGGIQVSSDSRLVLDRVTMDSCTSVNDRGGAILALGPVSVSNCTFLDNSARFGGAIVNEQPTATLNIVNSTFARNSATSLGVGGGAVFTSLDAATTIRNSTFVGNAAIETGGAVVNDDDGPVSISDSLFSGNTSINGAADFNDDAVTDGGGNAVAVPVSELMPFGDYGGPTPVQPLKFNSSVKGTAAQTALPATDQRGLGFPRTVGTGRDPGAVEGTELGDFQPDNRIGLRIGRQIGNNRYNTNGAGQTIALKLKGKRKAKTFFTVENDGLYLDSIRVKSDAPSRRSLNGKVFSLTGGRRNVSAQVFRTGLLLSDVVPSGSAAFEGEWSRKSLKVKPKQTAKLTSTSTTAPKSDVAATKVSGR